MKRILILFFVLGYLGGRAQEYYDDAQLWFNLYLEKKVTKRFLVHLNQQDRWVQNVSRFGLAYWDAGATYRFTENVKVLGDYVFAQKRRNRGDYKTRHQLYLAVVLKKDLGRWRFSYRNMLQVQLNSPFTDDMGYIPHYVDRNKFIIRYEATKRLSFYTAEELNVPLVNWQPKPLSRSRTFLGMFIDVTRHQQLEFYFMFQAQLQKGNYYEQQKKYPDNMLSHTYVYGIGYGIYF